MSLSGYRDAGLARQEGRLLGFSFRKVPSQASTAGQWVDLSMAAGNPPPNYYAASPLVAARFDPLKGIFHGDAVAPYTRHLAMLNVCTPTAAMLGQLLLMDYLLYYPFVDGDAPGEDQVMDNTVTLPDHAADGEEVQVMAVAVAPTTGGGSFTFDYIDTDGIARTSPVIFCNVAVANIATLITSEQGTVAGGKRFLPLTGASRGLKSITKVNVLTAIGGLFALVLVRPLIATACREVGTPREIEMGIGFMGFPEVGDDAYLNFILNPAGSVAAGQLSGYGDIIRSEG